MSKDEQTGVPIIRPLKRSDPDLRKLARALIALAIAKNLAEQEAQGDASDDTDAAADEHAEQGEQ